MSHAGELPDSVCEAAGKSNLPKRGYDTDSVSKLTLRPAYLSDAKRGGEICFEAFKTIAERHAFPPDFPSADAATNLHSQIIARPDVYSVVAELDGRVVGSNFLWEAGAVAGVGPITVEPAVQDFAVRRRLIEAVLERARLQEDPAVRLVQAAYHNRSMGLYTKLGSSPVSRCQSCKGPRSACASMAIPYVLQLRRTWSRQTRSAAAFTGTTALLSFATRCCVARLPSWSVPGA